VRNYFFLFLILPIWGPLHAAEKLLSPTAYFDEPEYRYLQVSPDGRYIAMVHDLPIDVSRIFDEAEDEAQRKKKRTLSFTGKTGGHQLVIYDLDERRFVKAINFDRHSIYWLHWATNDRLLISISISYNIKYSNALTVELPASRTISLDWRTENAVMLFAKDRAINRQNINLSRLVDPLPEDPDHVLMAAYKRGDLDLWKVNVISGNSDLIESGASSTFAWITDGNGGASFRLDRNTIGTVMRVYVRTPKGGWKKIISTRMNEKGEAPEFWPIARGDQQNEMYVLATPKDEKMATVKIYDLTLGAFTRTVASNDNFDFGGGLIDPNTGKYMGAWVIEDRYRLLLRDSELQKHIDAVNTFFERDANVRLIAASRNQSRLIFQVSSPTIPGDIYIYNYEERRIEPLFAARPKLLETTLAKVEVIQYETRDGLKITGYLTHPSNISQNKTAPLIVMPHGGPAARDSYDYNPFAQFLASRGYRVFQPNFRGSSGYGRIFLEAGYGEWGGAMQNDLADGVTYLRSRGMAPENKICIVGGSYGGYAALFAAMSPSNTYACAVSISGVTDLIEIVKYARNKTYGGEDTYRFAIQQIGDPKRDVDKLIRHSPARNVAQFDIPILIIHGRQDSIVPYAQAKKLMENLDAANISYEKYIVNDGHSFSKLSSTVQSMRKIEAFLKNHIGEE
jgi:dipeptidyl aminopeptidase/acylaminoacyl peptidase